MWKCLKDENQSKCLNQWTWMKLKRENKNPKKTKWWGQWEKRVERIPLDLLIVSSHYISQIDSTDFFFSIFILCDFVRILWRMKFIRGKKGISNQVKYYRKWRINNRERWGSKTNNFLFFLLFSSKYRRMKERRKKKCFFSFCFKLWKRSACVLRRKKSVFSQFEIEIQKQFLFHRFIYVSKVFYETW
jgi:hypothetical protein